MLRKTTGHVFLLDIHSTNIQYAQGLFTHNIIHDEKQKKAREEVNFAAVDKSGRQLRNRREKD